MANGQNVHIWIRKEDLVKWKAIVDKPEWLHNAINETKD